MFALMKLVLLVVMVIRTAHGLGDLWRNQAVAFLSAHSGWRVYTSNSLIVNPNLSIAPQISTPSPNSRVVFVGPGGGLDPIPAVATVGSSTTNPRNKHISRRGYDLDSLVIAPIPQTSPPLNETQVPATPMSLTFIPTGSHSLQCMVARVNIGPSTNFNNIITSMNPAGADCAIFVRNSTDTSLLDNREIRRCEVALRICGRSHNRIGRENAILFELTTLSP